MKILLAEDDEDDQLLFNDIVIKLYPELGAKFCIVENGVEVMDFLENAAELPDLLIMDQNMPQLTGKETLELIKNNERFADIPVVIYTTYNPDRLKNEFLTMGARQVITKPNSFQGLNQMVQGLLNPYLQTT